MSATREQICHIYTHVENSKCLCKFPMNVKDLWSQIYQKSFESNDTSEEENQLLCISFMRLIGEIIIDVTPENQYICFSIKQLFEVFLSEDLWNIFIYHLKCSKDKYLIWTFIKSFCIILYACKESIFSARIHGLLNDIKENIFEETNINILEFLSNLVDYSMKPSLNNNQMNCNNVVSKTGFAFTDLFQSLCGLLSQYWHSFMKQFHEVTTLKCDNQNLNRFLVLWQKLVEKSKGHKSFHSFLNEQFITAFLSNAYNLSVVSLRIYTDVVIQFFLSSIKLKSSSQSYNNSVEAAIVSALNRNFFDMLPRDYQISGFCIVINQKQDESISQSDPVGFPKCDSVIVKNITFIFLSLIADMKNSQLICTAVLKVFEFVKENFSILPDADVCIWTIDVFIDQDDILLGVMLALLRIYILLKEEDISRDFSKCVQVQNSLNPHEIFITFLQRIGFDHNELLSFLTSDETCFLLYILQYLKLLLREWDSFMKAHSSLIKVEEEDFEHSSACKTVEASSSNAYTPPAKRLLVSYSSSSSEEDLITVDDIHCKNQMATIQNNLVVIRTLIKLREAIKKLVTAKEFPYNVMPLISLLQACEDYCL